MRNFIVITAAFFKRIFKVFYWFYRISQIRSGKNLKLSYPLIVEGGGRIQLGDNNSIGHHTELGIHKNASLRFGNNSSIDKNVVIKIGDSADLTTGKHFSIERGSRIFVQNSWLFGDRVRIATNCQIFSREKGLKGKLTIGEGTHVGDGTIIDVSDDLKIANKVAIGPNCTLYTHDHDFREPGLDAPWHGKPVTHSIVIESGAWIGSNVTILPGVTIGTCAIIAAGAVVNKNIPAYALAGGVPAKIIENDYRSPQE